MSAQRLIQIKGYTINGHLLGEGGGGAVYSATANNSGRPVAIKVASITQKTAGIRFEREIKMMKDISAKAPGCVPKIFDSGVAQGHHWYSMELMDKSHLGELISQERFKNRLRAAVAAILGIQSSVNKIHALGYIHRDLKPHNIFWSNNRAIIIDFGIARDPGDKTITTKFMPHTPGYASPEQLLRDGKSVTNKSDIFSLAPVYARVLTGKSIYTGLDSRTDKLSLDNQRTIVALYKRAATSEIGRALLRDLGNPSEEIFLSRISGNPDFSGFPPTAPGVLGALIAAMCADNPSYRPDGELISKYLARVRDHIAVNTPSTKKVARDPEKTVVEAKVSHKRETNVQTLRELWEIIEVPREEERELKRGFESGYYKSILFEQEFKTLKSRYITASSLNHKLQRSFGGDIDIIVGTARAVSEEFRAIRGRITYPTDRQSLPLSHSQRLDSKNYVHVPGWLNSTDTSVLRDLRTRQAKPAAFTGAAICAPLVLLLLTFAWWPNITAGVFAQQPYMYLSLSTGTIASIAIAYFSMRALLSVRHDSFAIFFLPYLCLVVVPSFFLSQVLLGISPALQTWYSSLNAPNPNMFSIAVASAIAGIILFTNLLTDALTDAIRRWPLILTIYASVCWSLGFIPWMENQPNFTWLIYQITS